MNRAPQREAPGESADQRASQESLSELSWLAVLENTRPYHMSLVVTLGFWMLCYAVALNHAMWRDEWQPLVAARDTQGYAEFLEANQWMGMAGFFSFCWLVMQSGLGIWFFKLVLVTIAAVGIWVFCLHAPFSRMQKVFFAFGYFPFYEYGAIMRNYGIIFTTSVIGITILASPKMNPVAFGVCLAAMAQTHTFGVMLSLVFGATFLYELHRRRALTCSYFARPASVTGLGIAMISIVVAATPLVRAVFTEPEWVFAALTGGVVRTDSYFNRFFESLSYPARGWLPVPLFGAWNSHLLDLWPWSQVVVGLLILGAVVPILAGSSTATIFFTLGLAALGALFTQFPVTNMRHHGHYFVMLVLAFWLRESIGSQDARDVGRRGVLKGICRMRSPLLTGLLIVHAVVGMIFTLQEQVVPFSGSREAAQIIRDSEPPDVLVIADIDAWAMPVSGFLGRPVYVASRREFGSFVKIDPMRRWLPLRPDELAQIIEERLAVEQRDVVLVTNYPISVPADLGSPIGVVDRSITDERYFIFRIRYRRQGR